MDKFTDEAEHRAMLPARIAKIASEMSDLLPDGMSVACVLPAGEPEPDLPIAAEPDRRRQP